MFATLDQKAERLARELNALTEVAKTLVSPLELPKLLEAVLDKISGVLEPAEAGAIMLWDQSSGLFRPGAAFGYDPDIIEEAGLRAGESITGKVYDQGKAILLSTAEEVATAMSDMRPANRNVMARALNTERTPICTLAAPIAVGHQKFGVLVLEILEGPRTFSQEDLPFVQIIADLIALAIERARLAARADAVHAAREADHLRSELMATLSHELRMPLTAIKGYATALLLDEVVWAPDKQRDFLQMIEDECDHMEVMLTDILDSSLIEVDRLKLEFQTVCIAEVAQEIAAEMKRRTKLHNLIVDFPSDFPLVQADAHWIRQVFRNILDNAIKYSPAGGLIILHGEVRPSDIVISISDQGIGISPEDLIPLFEKYFRAKSPAGLKVPGTGLGLPIARTIVEAHGGRIWAESKVGQGTTLSFSLPKTHSQQAELRGE
jgi:K+-sensing histidine kinase KdpD